MIFARWILPLILYAVGGVLLGICLYPGLLLAWWLWTKFATSTFPVRVLAASLGLGCTYFIFGFMLLPVTGLLHRGLGLRLKPGEHPYFSIETTKWVIGSALSLTVKVLFMDFLVLSPLLTAYFRLLGAKLGRGVLINSKYIHDVSLLEVGDDTVIGGDAVISCHAAEGGKIILRPVRIGKNCIIGQHAIIMPGVTIGDNAVIGAQAMVLKNSIVGDGQTWVGIPAKPM